MSESVREIRGVGEKTEKLLKKMNVETVDQLVHHYPRCYTTYPDPVDLSDVVTGKRCSVAARITSPVRLRAGGRVKVVTCLISDQTGSLFLRWFNMPYLRNTLHEGDWYVFTGVPLFKDGRLMMEQPEYRTAKQYRQVTDTFQPVYPLTAGLSNKTLQKAQREAFTRYEAEEYLPETVRQYYNLESENWSLKEIHFPTGGETLTEARRRIIFDEFFHFFAALELVKEQEHQALNCHIIEQKDEVLNFIKSLPYELTGAQKQTLMDIRKDMGGTMAMNRLVQGDVGSGKTIIAMIAMYAVVLNGYQAVMMAPTEVLAEQHFDNFQKMLGVLGIRIELLTGSVRVREKRRIKEACKFGEVDILIGTHALLEEDVEFPDLALAVTDEQHRFGVRQRDRLMKKGRDPHVLVMSATPIPRTLGIILYRDLDVSIMNEMPASRKPIKNAVIEKTSRPAAWSFIEKQVKEGHQAYVICPMIEENESLDVENVEEYTRMLSQSLPLSVRIRSLNGRMSAAEKNKIMEAFHNHEIDVLVSTTVIEVGIDVPNATIMLIENAERFGLSQLHQLRGRVGRGSAQSYCIFLSGSSAKEAMDRLSVIGHSNDGFEIANEDLKLRGPGEFFGTKQSGTMNFALGDIYSNADIMKEASEAVAFLKDTDFDFRTVYPEEMERGLDFAKDI